MSRRWLVTKVLETTVDIDEFDPEPGLSDEELAVAIAVSLPEWDIADVQARPL